MTATHSGAGRFSADARVLRSFLANAAHFCGPAKTACVRLSVEGGPDGSVTVFSVSTDGYAMLAQSLELLAHPVPHRPFRPVHLPPGALRKALPNAKVEATVEAGELHAAVHVHGDEPTTTTVDYFGDIDTWFRAVGELSPDPIPAGFTVAGSAINGLASVTDPVGGPITWALHATDAAPDARPIVAVPTNRTKGPWRGYVVMASRPVDPSGSAVTVLASTPKGK